MHSSRPSSAFYYQHESAQSPFRPSFPGQLTSQHQHTVYHYTESSQHSAACSRPESPPVPASSSVPRPRSARVDPASVPVAAGLQSSQMARRDPSARFHSEAPTRRPLAPSSTIPLGPPLADRDAAILGSSAAGLSSAFVNDRASEFRPHIKPVESYAQFVSEEPHPTGLRGRPSYDPSRAGSRPIQQFDSARQLVLPYSGPEEGREAAFKPSLKLIPGSDRVQSRNPILQESDYYAEQQSYRPSKRLVFSQPRSEHENRSQQANANLIHHHHYSASEIGAGEYVTSIGDSSAFTRIHSNMTSEELANQEFHSPTKEQHRGKKTSPLSHRPTSVFPSEADEAECEAEHSVADCMPVSPARLAWSASRAPHSHRPLTSVPPASRNTRSSDCFEYDDGSLRVGLDFSLGGISRQRQAERQQYEKELETIRNRLRQENQQRWHPER